MLSAQSVIEAMGQELEEQYPDLISFVDQGLEEEEGGSWFLWIGVAHMDMLIIELTTDGEFVVTRFTDSTEEADQRFSGADAYRQALAAAINVLDQDYA